MLDIQRKRQASSVPSTRQAMSFDLIVLHAWWQGARIDFPSRGQAIAKRAS